MQESPPDFDDSQGEIDAIGGVESDVEGGIDSYPDGSTDDDGGSVGRCRGCCNRLITELAFLDNSTQFSCILLYAFIPMVIMFITFLVWGIVEAARGNHSEGIPLLVMSICVPTVIYIGVVYYIEWYRSRYSENIGSHGYFPCCGRR